MQLCDYTLSHKPELVTDIMDVVQKVCSLNVNDFYIPLQGTARMSVMCINSRN